MRRWIATVAVFALAVGAERLPAQPASWLSAGVRAERDNQPRDMLLANAEYGRYLTPTITLAGTVTALRIGGISTAEPGAVATLSLPATRLGMTAGVGTVLAAPGGAPLLWTARAGLNLGHGLSLRIGHARDRYTATLASLDTSVFVRTAEARLDRASAPGWAGELVARHESFGDANPVTTVWGWALAPLSRSSRHSLRTGYSLSVQDAAHSNWVADEMMTPPAGQPAPAVVAGRYEPYYTPHNVVVHNVLAAAALAAGGGWVMFDAAYGVRATELAPEIRSLINNGTADTVLLFHERSFSPYRIAAAWTAPLRTSAAVTVELSHARTAYYRTTSAGLRFIRSPAR